MANILIDTCDCEVAEVVLEQLDDCSFTAQEAIPGLVKAIALLAERTSDPEQALDEAADILAATGEV